MTRHLSRLEVKQLCVSALPQDGLAAAAVHTSECESCNQRFVEELKRQRGLAPFNFTLEPAFWFRNEHLKSDDLVRLADKSFDEETREIINIHLSTCETCGDDLRSFLAFRDATAREMNVSYGPTYYERSEPRSGAPWWQQLQRNPVYAVAAIVLLAMAVVIGIFALSKTSEPLGANKQDQVNPDTQQNPSLSPHPGPNVVSSPSTVDNSTKVAVLKDATGEVTIYKSGEVTGLDQVSASSRQYVARAALSEQLEPADILRRLSPKQSSLRSNDNVEQKIRLLYPLRRVVTEDRPVFRWDSLPNASSYRVYVLDADGNQIGQSEELAPTQTRWKIPVRLTRGQIFSWVVTAAVDGKKIVSPSASAPEMKFAVLSRADFQELTRLKQSNSHIALGVFYARAGLVDQAEHEFQSLVELNPESETPRKLLQSVRALRKVQ